MSWPLPSSPAVTSVAVTVTTGRASSSSWIVTMAEAGLPRCPDRQFLFKVLVELLRLSRVNAASATGFPRENLNEQTTKTAAIIPISYYFADNRVWHCRRCRRRWDWLVVWWQLREGFYSGRFTWLQGCRTPRPRRRRRLGSIAWLVYWLGIGEIETVGLATVAASAFSRSAPAGSSRPPLLPP